MDKALFRQIVEAIPDVYLASLKHHKLGYATVTTLAALQHLCAHFGTVTDKDMNSNIDRIEKPWDTSLPIEVVFKQIDDGQAFATEHDEPLFDSQLTRYAYAVVFNTGQFNDECKEWRNKPTTGKTWPLFKTFFRSMDKDRREQLTSAKGGFQGLAYKAMQVQT